MSRILRALVYNWPLKLLAILLASLLYAGLVVSQSSFEIPTAIAIRPINQPLDATILNNLGSVSRIRYVSNGDAGAAPTADTFQATIDLEGVNPAAGSTYVKVDVSSNDPRFLVISYEPPGINVQLDPTKTFDVPVTVDKGTPPDNLDIRPAELSTRTVKVSGPESIVKFVVAARADVVIDPAGVFIDRDVPLIPVDQAGKRVSQVRVDPATVRVRIAVYTDSKTKALAVKPNVTGTAPSGYAISSITVTPPVISVEGDAADIAGLVQVETEPIPLGSATDTIEVDAKLALPANVLPLGLSTVHVTITLRAETGTRTFDAAVVLNGRQPGLDYRIPTGVVQVVIGGPVADLDRLDGSQFTVAVDVTGLAPGTHQLAPVPNLQAGLRLLTVDPATVTVTITPQGSPAPSPAPSGG